MLKIDTHDLLTDRSIFDRMSKNFIYSYGNIRIFTFMEILIGNFSRSLF